MTTANKLLSYLCLLPLFILSAKANEVSLEQMQSYISEWIQTEKLISQERSQWKKDKVLLQDTLHLLTQEHQKLQKRINDASTQINKAKDTRNTLTARKHELEQAMSSWNKKILQVEKNLKQLVPSLPEKLKTKLDPLLKEQNKLQQSPLSQIGERLLNLLACLQQINHYNNKVHLESQLLKVGSYPTQEYKILYLGLSNAYGLNKKKTVSIIGKPTNGGWVWSEKKKFLSEITTAIAIKENKKQAQFISLPTHRSN